MNYSKNKGLFQYTSKKTNDFVNTFRPYRQKYTIKEHAELFDESIWFTQNKYLSKKLIEKAILEKLAVGYFLTTVPNVLGIDIDDHRNQGESYLLSVYNQLIGKLGTYPSLLVKSPRGLHSYWILNQRLPADVLHKAAAGRIGAVPVEIRPTPTTSLRIPAEKRFIDPRTRQLLNLPFDQVLQTADIYHPAFLFDDSFLPEKIRETLRERRSHIRALKAIPKIETVENELLPFIDGFTNDKYLRLVTAYRLSGFTVEDAIYRFAVCLAQSPGYNGDLRDPQRLKKRIESSFKNIKYKPKPREIQNSLFNQVIIDSLVEIQPFAKQREKPIERFIGKVLSWADWHDEIIRNSGKTAFFDYLYPYYRKNRKAGLYPLPSNYFKKQNFRYYELFDWLIDTGFIERSGFNYSTWYSQCKYYRILRDKYVV